MIDHLFFYLGLSLLLVHEMDAVRCKEWRIFPGLSLLNDKMGYLVFTIAHIPLFFWLVVSLSDGSIEKMITGWDYFFIAHLGLHLLFLKHTKNEFKDWISWIIISGIAVCGLLDILNS